MNKRGLSLSTRPRFVCRHRCCPTLCVHRLAGQQPIRSEGIAEYIADVVVVCSGGNGDRMSRRKTSRLR